MFTILAKQSSDWRACRISKKSCPVAYRRISTFSVGCGGAAETRSNHMTQPLWRMNEASKEDQQSHMSGISSDISACRGTSSVDSDGSIQARASEDNRSRHVPLVLHPLSRFDLIKATGDVYLLVMYYYIAGRPHGISKAGQAEPLGR
jgi:hypothetical protein